MSDLKDIDPSIDPKEVMQRVEDSLKLYVENFINVLRTGLENDQSDNSSVLASVRFSQQLWTTMVWEDWTKRAEIEEREGIQEGEDTVHALIAEYFPTIVDDIAEGLFIPEHNQLPLEKDDIMEIGYFSGFYELDAWKKLNTQITNLGLKGALLLMPVFEEGDLGISVYVWDDDERPIKRRIEFNDLEFGIPDGATFH